jgi:DamX protein
MQKLDLLKHLVDNLANVIVVCGPEGIGKTRLLKFFANEHSAPSAILSWLDGASGLHFDQAKESLSSKIAEVLPELKTQPLSVALERLHSRGLSIVQIIDDAGLLAPGLIGKIVEYANAHAALKVIFALSHDDLYIKSGTDPVLEDCYQIEVPPLTQQQCEDYLEYLSTLPNPRIDFSTISEERVTEIFSETHGIPGKILAYLPEPVVQKTVDYTKPALLAAVAALVLAVIGVQWWSGQRGEAVETATVSAGQNRPDQIKAVENSPETMAKPAIAVSAAPGEPAPTPLSPAIDAAGKPSSPAQNPAEPNQPAIAAAPPATQAGNPVAVMNGSENTQNNPGVIAQPSPASNETGDTVAWVNAQPPESITMQLMALGNEQDIIAVMERYPELKSEMRYVKSKTKRGFNRFLLFYGAFTDPAQAQTQRQGLPKELKQAWVRKFADVQKQLNPEPENQALSTPTP